MSQQTRYILHDEAETPNPGSEMLPDVVRRNDQRNPDEKPRRPMPVWALLLVCSFGATVVLAGYLFLRPLAEMFSQFIQEYRDVLSTVFLAVVALLTIALVRIVFALTKLLNNKAVSAGVIRLESDFPVYACDIEQGWIRPRVAQFAAASIDRFYEVQATWGEHSDFRGLGSYSPSLSLPASRQQDTGKPAASALPVSFVEGKPKLEQLRERGLVATGRETLFVGYTDDGNPQFIELANTSFIALTGKPRSGKTTTVKLLLAQAALMNFDIAICDPHARQSHGLLNQTQFISGAFFKQAVEPDEIAAAIQLVQKIGRRRLDNPTEITSRVLLVIDEFTGLVMRKAIPAAVLANLVEMAVEFPKVRVNVILIAHDWSAQTLGAGKLATPLRRAITHKIVHRSDPANAEFLIPQNRADDVQHLTKGKALYWGDDEPTIINVPLLDLNDFVYAAQGKPPREYRRAISLEGLLQIPIQPKQKALPTNAGDTLTAAAPVDTPPSGAIAETIIEELGTKRLTLRELGIALPQYTTQQLYYCLHRLVISNSIKREGTRRNYKYYIAEAS